MSHPHPYYFQERARVLKSQGDSINAIAQTMGIPRSTVSIWVRGMHEEPAMLKYCARCGDAFLARRRDTKYCPHGCGRNKTPRIPKPMKQCEYCGAEFRRIGGSSWCCDEHRDLAERKRDLAERQRVCKWCEETFTAYPASRRYCCDEHKRLAVNAARLPKRPERWCPECGVKFVPHHALQKFCSKPHQRLYYASHQQDGRELVAA